MSSLHADRTKESNTIDLSDATLPEIPKLVEFIYYILDKETNTIKIGRSFTPETRLKCLQSGNSTELKIIGWHDGDSNIERLIHKLFKKDRVHGEWYKNTPELLQFIETQQALQELRDSY